MTPIPDCMAEAAERARFIGCNLAAELIEQRRAYGIATHGVPLAWPNGRNWLADWTQEALDAAAGYTTGLVAEMRQQGAPKHLIHGVLAHSTGALELIEAIEEWRRSASLPDLLTQQPPPEGGHEAPDVARRKLAAARDALAALAEAGVLIEVDSYRRPDQPQWKARITGIGGADGYTAQEAAAGLQVAIRAASEANSELAVARAVIASLRGSLDLLQVQRAATERAHDAALQAAVDSAHEVITMQARVVELEEALRWRPASERPEVGAPVELAWRDRWSGTAARAIGQLRADGLWCTDDYDPGIMDAVPEERILGWRPLGPGPEVTP